MGFVMLVGGLVLLGPTLVELVEGPPRPPPAQPIAPSAPQERGPPPAPIAAATDAGSTQVAVAPPPPVIETPPPAPEKKDPVGFVSITSTPSGLSVALKGDELGKTPLKHVALPVGKQALIVTDAKGRKKSAVVTVKEGKDQKVSWTWAKLK